MCSGSGDDAQGLRKHGLSDFIGGESGTFAALTGENLHGDFQVDALALFLGEAAPHAIRLPGSDGVVGAFDPDRTPGAHGFGAPITPNAR